MQGYFSGKSHTFAAKVSPHPVSSPSYTIEGQWNASSKIVSVSSSASSKRFKKGDEFVEGERKFDEIGTEEVEAMGEWESRRVWKEVADGIRKGDFDSSVPLSPS